MSDKNLDTTGMKCPKPLFEVSKMMKTIAPDEVLEVLADDPAFKPDIEAWCRRTGNALLEIRADGRRLVARVKKNT
jgi:tRNA 2-thiouridine synthesizing protein A